MHKKYKIELYNLLILICFIMTSGCQSTGPSSNNLVHSEIKLAQQSGFKSSVIKTKNFELTSLIKKSDPVDSVKKLVIYIEGDGRSWIKKSILSKNPTPPYALGLRLAIQDPRGQESNTTIAYLARPCQFTEHKPTLSTCDAKYWSSDRFSEVVIANMNEAINKIKTASGFENQHKIELIGYSGGAGVAVLVAARRNDVDILRTVAGDLNHDMMSEYHHTTPLPHSLNPISFANKLSNVKQIHYIGNNDKIVPKKVTESFINECDKYLEKQALKPVIVAINATHQKGWETQWEKIIFSTKSKILAFSLLQQD